MCKDTEILHTFAKVNIYQIVLAMNILYLNIVVCIAGMMFTLAAGCNKKSSGDGGSEPTVKLLPSEICYSIDEESGVAKIFYDSINRITKVEYDYFSEYYEYDKSGRLISISTTLGDTISLSYSGNYIFICYENSNYTRKFELKNGKVIKIYEVKEGKDVLIGTYSYDSNGNLIYGATNTESESLGITLHSTLDFSAKYANKKGVYSGLSSQQSLAFPAIDRLGFQVVNNPLSVNYDGEYSMTFNGETTSGTIIATDTYRYEEFNGDYPTKIKVTYKDNQIPLMKTNMLDFFPSFNLKNKNTRNTSSTIVYYYEIKYIEAR